MQRVFSHLRESFKLENGELENKSHTHPSSESNFLVLDAYHTAASSFKKLESLVKEDKSSSVEDVLEEITDFVEKLHETKKSKSS